MNTEKTLSSRSGAQCVIEGLEAIGCETLFGYPGGTVLDIFDALGRSTKIHFVLVRHEQGAAHMADGYARATGKCGFCLATSGPGATNTVTGLATANADGIPVICITGQVPTPMIGNDAFQEADTCGITRSITKHNYLVRNVDDLPRIIKEAHYIATTGKPGVVLIDIPKDIQQAKTSAPIPEEVSLRGYRPSYDGHPKMVAKLADAINKSQRPLLYVGGGVIASNTAETLTAIARKGRLPVTTTLLGLGAFPETDPLALRMIGMHGSYAANTAIQHCDLLVSVGARFDDRVTGKLSEFPNQCAIAHIDIDPCAIGKSVKVDIPVVGHLRPILDQLLPLIETKERTEWHEQLSKWKAHHSFKYRFGSIPVDSTRTESPTPIPAQYVIERAYAISEGKALVCTEVGQHQMFAAQFYKHTQPRHFLSSGGLGTMGFGLPAAIGAQFGRPDALVVLFAGDGAVQMNFQEVVVAVEHNIPIKIIILNNGVLGMVRQWQEMFYKKHYSGVILTQTNRPPNERMPQSSTDNPVCAAQARLPVPHYLPDFVKLAEAHGASARRIERLEDVDTALAAAFSDRKTWVLEFIVEPEGSVLPMVPPGKAHKDIVTEFA